VSPDVCHHKLSTLIYFKVRICLETDDESDNIFRLIEIYVVLLHFFFILDQETLDLTHLENLNKQCVGCSSVLLHLIETRMLVSHLFIWIKAITVMLIFNWKN
jgi:hypothetical protein